MPRGKTTAHGIRGGDDQLPLRARKKQQARERILRAAERLIRTHGYQQTKMRDVAATAEISYQTLYNYFPTKGSLLRTLLTRQVEDVARRYQELIDQYQGGLIRTLDALNAVNFSVFADGDRDLWRIAMVEMLEQGDESVRIYRFIVEMAHDLLNRLLVKAHHRGELAADVHLPTLGDVIFDLADYALLKFILDPSAGTDAAQAALSAEIRFVVSPCLAGAR